MRAIAPVLAVLALGAPGCGTEHPPTADRERARVVSTVHELQRAAQRGDAAEICRRVLARGIADQLQAAGVDCQSEVRRALRRVARFGLIVEGVRVSREAATAVVRSASARRSTRHVVALVKQGGQWRVASIASR